MTFHVTGNGHAMHIGKHQIHISDEIEQALSGAEESASELRISPTTREILSLIRRARQLNKTLRKD